MLAPHIAKIETDKGTVYVNKNSIEGVLCEWRNGKEGIEYTGKTRVDTNGNMYLFDQSIDQVLIGIGWELPGE